MIRLAVNGAQGRMGKRICALAQDDQRFELVAQHDVSSADINNAKRAGSCDVVIDFSTDEGAQHAARLAGEHNAALLVGTTALSSKTREILGKSADAVPVMIAPNTSLGVAVLSHLVAEAARMLDGFDIDIIDVHHSAKRDAPSGTALRLVDALRENGGVSLDPNRVHSIRAGDVVGDHEVIFAGPGERIKISHFATSRDVFALGALRAAAWLARQRPGMYTVEQSLGLG